MQEQRLVGGVNDRLAEQAARWYARLCAPECGPADRSAFEKWLNEHESHPRAFEAASRTAASVSDALSRDARLRALLEADLKTASWPAPRLPAWRTVGLAAGWIAAIGLTLFAARPWFSSSESRESLVSYVNAEHREKTVSLTDGSLLHLDVGAEVRVAMSQAHRRLTLLTGRAYFEVAHDQARPFSVDAAGTRTVALGTKFEVSMQPQSVVVTLAQGMVSVTPTDSTADWKETLTPGQQLVVDPARRHSEKRSVDAATVTGWSSGRLHFDGTPLRQVLAEVNRYSSTKVVLGDDRLAGIPIGGTFAAGGDAGAFVQALSAILPLRGEPSGDNDIVIYQREHEVIAN